MVNRRGDSTLSKLIWAGLVLAMLYGAATVYPAFLVKFKLGEVVQIILLEWRDHNKARAKSRLAVEMKKRDIPDYVYTEDCEFFTQQQEKHLDCWWEVDLELFGYKRTLDFSVHKYLDANENAVWVYED